MHYQHQFHAGNFADVFKHVLLLGLLESFNQKDSAWAYLDTHAGVGRYALSAEAALRTGEAATGVQRLLDDDDPLPPWLMQYRSLVRLQPGRYPGSPAIAAAMRRPQDRLMLCEKQPAIFAQLKSEMRGSGHALHERDGYQAFSLLPPPEKRALVLVDPPFEARDEFDRLTEFAAATVARMAHAVLALWYPVKQRHAADSFVRRLGRTVKRDAVDARIFVSHPQDARMRGCGLAVINPPYAFQQALPAHLAVLADRLAQGPGAGYALEPIAS